jgi:Nickel responsive protein SCO4226-like
LQATLLGQLFLALWVVFGKIDLISCWRKAGNLVAAADWIIYPLSPFTGGFIMPKFMSTHQLPPGGMSREQVCQMGAAASKDEGIKPYRSFLNLSEGKAVCVIESDDKEHIAAWFKKVGMPYDSITQVELEGVSGTVDDA